MRNLSVWKGITVFSLALLIGTFVSDFYNKISLFVEIEKTVVLTPQEKNCVFADEKLNYRILPLKAEKKFAPLSNETKKLILIPKPVSETAKTESNMKEIIAEPQFEHYKPSQDTTGFQTLLHIEKCYESDGRK